MTDGGLESGAEEIDEQGPRARKDVAHQVYHVSKELRNLLLDVNPVLSWPPKADELQSDAVLVPDMLNNMLAWILTSDTEFSTERVTNLPNHVHRWILSLGQDLIHCVSRGLHKDSQACAITHDSQKPHWECRTGNSLEQIWSWSFIFSDRRA